MKKSILILITLIYSLAGSAQTTLPAGSKLINNQLYQSLDGGVYIYKGSTYNPNAYFKIGTTSDVSAATPILYNPTTGVISSQAASVSQNGYLTSTDWSIFNNKAPLASPVFTGVPTAPTATAGTNTNQIATTAFVTATAGTIYTGGVNLSSTSANATYYLPMVPQNTSGASVIYVGTNSPSINPSTGSASFIGQGRFTSGSSGTAALVLVGGVSGINGDGALQLGPNAAANFGLIGGTGYNGVYLKGGGGTNLYLDGITTGNAFLTGGLIAAGVIEGTNFTGSGNAWFGGNTSNASLKLSGLATSSPQFQFTNSSGTPHWGFYQTIGAGGVIADFHLFNYITGTDAFFFNKTSNAMTIPSLGAGGDRLVSTTNAGGLGGLGIGAGLAIVSGNLTATGGSAGTISGSGIAGYLTKFTGAGSVGNSIITESGSTISVGGTLSASNLSGTNTGDQVNIAGNSATATALQTARTIAGVSFNGTANISLNNNAITNGAGYITTSALTGYAQLSGATFTGAIAGTSAVFSGDVTANSDIRLKKDITPLNTATVALRSIGAYSYKWKYNGANAIGLIAQELQKYYPDLVKADERGILSINYQNFGAVLLQGWKEHDERISKLEQK